MAIASLLAAGVFAAGITVAYQYGVDAGGSESIPLITADGKPIKIRPESPGGMEIPNQDKAIFRQLAQSGGPAEIERLIPDEERPIEDLLLTIKPAAKPAAAGEDAGGDAAAAPTVPPPPARPAPVQKNAESEAPPAAAEHAARRKKLPSSSVLPTGQTVPPPPAPPARETTPEPVKQAASTATTATKAASATRGRYRVQIASVSTADAARRAWAKLNKSNPDLFSGLEQSVVRKNLGSKGTWYRIVAGPFPSEDAARAFCGRAKQRKLGCLLVQP